MLRLDEHISHKKMFTELKKRMNFGDDFALYMHAWYMRIRLKKKALGNEISCKSTPPHLFWPLHLSRL